MASTPPPPAVRAHTPPTPLHGLRYDNYEPYSPRRSKRSTAQSNPYSSFNSDKSPRAARGDASTPPATVKKTRFARAPTQLSSPPSSPVSPAQHRSPRQLHKTPRKQHLSSSNGAANGAHSDSDGSSSPQSFTAPPTTTMHPITMLPTPSKTPKKKRQAKVASTARILSFQPSDPNDVMPSPHKVVKHRPSRGASAFELYEDDHHRPTARSSRAAAAADDIEIFTDANARIPELDGSEDNPFVGPKRVGRRSAPKRSSANVSHARRAHDARIDEAADNDEGMTYVFRGRKIFRRFEKPPTSNNDDDQSVAESEVSGSYEQRNLRHQAGVAAQRPLTRSAIKPRLLFPSKEQQLEREQAEDDDEEALTDIDMSNAEYSTTHPTEPKSLQTPQQKRSHAKGLASPPSTTRSKRSTAATAKVPAIAYTPVVNEDDDNNNDVLSIPEHTFPAGANRGKKHSPFDSWQRTKSSSRKRAGEGALEGAGGEKKARSAALASPV